MSSSCRHEGRKGSPPTAVAKAEAHTALRSPTLHLRIGLFRLSILPDPPNRLPPEEHRARRRRHLRRLPRCHSQVDTRPGLAQPLLTVLVRQTKYLGIPYAHPPIGALRFRPPVPYVNTFTNSTSRPVHSYNFGPSCPQSTPVPYPISEDCLTVNVWVPHVPQALKSSLGEEIARGLPVLVWICASFSTYCGDESNQCCIDGGAFINGSTQKYPADGLVEASIELVCHTLIIPILKVILKHRILQ